MTFGMMRLIIELGLSLHFFLRLRLAFGGGWWQAPVLLGLGLLLAPMFPQTRNLLPQPVLNIILQITPYWSGYLICFTVLSIALDLLRLAILPFPDIVSHKWLTWLLAVILPLMAAMPLWAGFMEGASLTVIRTINFWRPLWPLFLLVSILLFLNIALAHGKISYPGLADFSWWKFFSLKRMVPLTLILSLGLSLFAYYEAYHPRLVNLSLSTSKMPPGRESLRIVQLTDVHLSGFIGHEELARVVEMVKGAKPDILVVTGDLVDGDISQRGGEADLLATIKPPYGSYAVLGNHELYRGTRNSLDFYQRAGLRLLRGEAVATAGIVIAGVDDEAFGDSGNQKAPVQLLRAYAQDPRFMLFLKHRPRLTPGTAGLFDLQLSGHTHGGQIWPGHYLIKRANGVVSGLH